MDTKIIGIASDHAGYALKQFVKQYLVEKGMPYKDYGTFTEESCDYSDFGHALAEGIERGEVYPGIAICGSGEGINTSVTTLIVLLAIFILGGDSIRSFSFAMILGVVFGTLSSIFIAAPVAYLTLGRTIKEEEVPAKK